MAAPGKGAGTIGTTEALKKKTALEAVDEEFAPHAKKVKEELDDVDRHVKEAYKILEAVKTKLLHPKAIPLHDAIKQERGGKATAKLDPDNAAASRMQKMTNSILSKRDVKKASWHLQNNPSETDGDCAFYKYGDETIENKRGKIVIKNLSIVKTEQWKMLEKDNRGLPGYIARKSRNLKELIPKYSKLLANIFDCGKDYWLIAEEPKSWDLE